MMVNLGGGALLRWYGDYLFLGEVGGKCTSVVVRSNMVTEATFEDNGAKNIHFSLLVMPKSEMAKVRIPLIDLC